jgi:hypothetical protein
LQAFDLLIYRRVIRFQLDFEPHQFERPLIEQTKDEVRNRLEGHSISRLFVTLRKAFGSSNIQLHLRGDDEDVRKASRLLGLA